MRPLVVDLDGTLIPTDLLDETATQFLAHHPASAWRLAGWLVRGRSTLKRELADRAAFDVEALPLRDDVVEWLRGERASGRRMILATASDSVLAEAVARRLDLFDEVLASRDGRNLKGIAKRDLLVERFGRDGFDYVGDSTADLDVWSHAHTAHVVGAKGAERSALAARAGRTAEVGRSFDQQSGGWRALIGALRPHQWVKNVLVLVPLITAQLLNDGSAIAAALIALIAFSLVSSSVYVINDLVDLDHDRRHPHKRTRPFASGALSLRAGWVAWPTLLVGGLALAVVALPLAFTAALVGYFCLTLAYSLRLKRIPVVDVVTLGLLYTSRIVAGAAALDVALSMWLLTFSMFFFLSLALIKRVSELSRIRRTMDQVRGRGYVESDLELLSSYGVASSVAAVVIFSLYVNEPTTSALYETPELLWCSVPLMLGWLMRAWLLAHRGVIDEDPLIFAIRDRAGRLVGAGIVAIFVAAKLIAW